MIWCVLYQHKHHYSMRVISTMDSTGHVTDESREVVLILTQEFCMLYLRFLIVFLFSVWDIGYLFLLWFVYKEICVYPSNGMSVYWLISVYKIDKPKTFCCFVQVCWGNEDDYKLMFLTTCHCHQVTLKPVGCIFCMCSGVLYRTDIFSDHDLCQTIWG